MLNAIEPFKIENTSSSENNMPISNVIVVRKGTEHSKQGDEYRAQSIAPLDEEEHQEEEDNQPRKIPIQNVFKVREATEN